MARPALAASRAVDILNFLTSHPSDVFTLSELVSRLGINVASAHAILRVLEHAGFVTRHPRHKTYGLGPSVVALGHAALERHRVIDVAREEMRRLGAELDLEVLATVRAGAEALAVARAGRFAGAGASLQVGQRVPLVPPFGPVFLAWEDEREVAAWLASAGSDVPAEALERQHHALSAMRERGYSVGLEMEVREQLGEVIAGLADEPRDGRLRGSVETLIGELGHEGYHLDGFELGRKHKVSVIAAPVFDAQGGVALALSLIGFRAELTTGEVERYGRRLLEACRGINRATWGRSGD